MAKDEYVFGLFEGGGAKGIAYAGVIEACHASGIRFEGACGVSAGAIAAALVSAGLPSESVARYLKTPLPNIIGWQKRPILQRLFNAAYRWVTCDGYLSSEGIERWMEHVLSTELGISSPVRFMDLPRPLAILAYESEGKTPHIWSSKRTEGASVAFAVRASCTIPFYFSPAKNKQGVFLDGGLIENVPTFLVQELTQNTVLPTLAFRLVNSGTRIVRSPLFRGPFRRLMDFVGNVIDARSSVSRDMRLAVVDVQIDCGNVNTTRFKLSVAQRDALVIAGRDAVALYRSVDKEAPPMVNAHHDVLTEDEAESQKLQASKTRHDTLLQTGKLIDSATTSIDVFAGDISWLEGLAPYIIQAGETCVSHRLIAKDFDPMRIEYARHLGFSVGIVADSQPLRGTMIDSAASAAQILLVEKTGPATPTLLSATQAPRALAHFSTVFEEKWSLARVLPAYQPLLRRLDLTEIERALRRVPQYLNADISIEKLSPKIALPSSKFVETFKLARIQHVYALYQNIDGQKGYHIVGTPWFSVWPVVERRKDGLLVVIDGTHRFYDAFIKGADVWCLVVNGCDEELPSDPVASWDRVRLTTAKLDRSLRFNNYRPEKFRPLKATLSGFFSQS